MFPGALPLASGDDITGTSGNCASAPQFRCRLASGPAAHWITSSARSSSDCGIARPSARAVFRSQNTHPKESRQSLRSMQTRCGKQRQSGRTRAGPAPHPPPLAGACSRVCVSAEFGSAAKANTWVLQDHGKPGQDHHRHGCGRPLTTRGGRRPNAANGKGVETRHQACAATHRRLRIDNPGVNPIPIAAMPAIESSSAPSPQNLKTGQVTGTASFSKFVQVLQLISDLPPPVVMAKLVLASGYPRPTVYRIVAALAAEKFIQENPRTGAFELGTRLLQLASKSWGRSGLRLVSVDVLKNLRDTTGETVHLAVPSGQQMVYIEKLESPSAVQMASRIGTTVCMHATAVGKAYLSALDPEVRKKIIAGLPLTRYTANTLQNIDALEKNLKQITKKGWSEDLEEHEAGIHCFGAPVLGESGVPVAAVSVSTLRFRQKQEHLENYVKPLMQACQEISQRIAHAPVLRGSSIF